MPVKTFLRKLFPPIALAAAMLALVLSLDAPPAQAQDSDPLVPDESPDAQPVRIDHPAPNELPDDGGFSPELEAARALDTFLARAEQAYRDGDLDTLRALSAEAQPEWQFVLDELSAGLVDEPPPQPEGATRGGGNVGINGAACVYPNIGTAINDSSSGDTIYIRPGTYIEFLPELNNTKLVLFPATSDCTAELTTANSDSVTVDANGFSANSNGGLVRITNGSVVTFRHMTLRNANATNGGVMYIDDADVTLDDADVENGVASSLGGGVRVIDGVLTLSNQANVFHNSTTLGSGGGVAAQNSTVVINDGDIGTGATSNNTAANNGGAIYAVSSAIGVTHINSDLRNNTATAGFGGAIYGESTSIDITEGEINNNTGTEGGGAIYLTGPDSSLDIANGVISFNQAPSAGSNQGGGAIYVDGSIPVTIANSTLQGNFTNNIGGAFQGRTNTDVTVTDSTFFTNTSSGSGGAFYMAQSSSSLHIFDSNLTDNSAGSNGGAISTAFTPVLLDNTTVEDNRADRGGGLYMNLNDYEIRNNSQIIFNQAEFDGGGIYSTGSDGMVADSMISGNEALDTSTVNYGQGGGMYAFDTRVVFTDTYFTVNSARHTGGGVYITHSDSTFDMTNGGFSANATTNSASNQGAGALYADGAIELNFTGAVIEGNTSIGSGGAFHFRNGADAIYEDSLVFFNQSNGSGGAFYSAQSSSSITFRGGGLFDNTAGTTGGAIQATFAPVFLENTEVYENEADNGGGLHVWLAEATLDNVLVYDNIALESGGGIYAQSADINFVSTIGGARATACDPFSLPADEYCSEIRNNQAGEYGGGMYILGSNSGSADGIVNLDQVALIDNDALLGGAALYTAGLTPTVTLTNVLVMGSVNNDAVEVSDAITLTIQSSSLVANFDNPMRVSSNQAVVTMHNTMIWDNIGGPYVIPGAPFSRTCNHSQAIESGSQSMGASGTDPQFEVTARGQYRLSAGSPARDACGSGPDVGLDGMARPAGPDYDRGAFERPCPLPAGVVGPAIGVSSGSVELSWSAISGATNYLIYRAANDFYFTPGGLYGTDSSSPYLDPDSDEIGDTANNYAYIMQATNECGSTGHSQRVGEFDFPMTPGD